MTDRRFSEAPVPGQLTIDARLEGDSMVLTLGGELDLASSPRLEHELEDAAGAPGAVRLIVDLAGLEFIDSTGLQTLLRARDRATANGGEFMLRRGPHQVQRVFELTKTLDVFAFDD